MQHLHVVHRWWWACLFLHEPYFGPLLYNSSLYDQIILQWTLHCKTRFTKQCYSLYEGLMIATSRNTWVVDKQCKARCWVVPQVGVLTLWLCVCHHIGPCILWGARARVDHLLLHLGLGLHISRMSRAALHWALHQSLPPNDPKVASWKQLEMMSWYAAPQALFFSSGQQPFLA